MQRWPTFRRPLESLNFIAGKLMVGGDGLKTYGFNFQQISHDGFLLGARASSLEQVYYTHNSLLEWGLKSSEANAPPR